MRYFFLATIIFCFISASAQENPKYININGTSEVIRSADQINFTIRIKTIKESIEESKINNDKNLEELLAILNKFGITSEDIEVTPIKLGKNFEFDGEERRQTQKGYFVEIGVSFLLKDLTKYYDLINNLAKSNSFEVTNAFYSISDYEVQHKIAYENALKAAKEKAEYMTKTLGLNLGTVLEIDENNLWQSYPNPMNTASIESSQGGNISGKVNLRRSVRVKFAIN